MLCNKCPDVWHSRNHRGTWQSSAGVQQQGWGLSQAHRHAVTIGNREAVQDSARVTQLIWNNWKHLSPGLICCMSGYRLCDDLTWDRGSALGKSMAPSHQNGGSCWGPFPIAGSKGAPSEHPAAHFSTATCPKPCLLSAKRGCSPRGALIHQKALLSANKATVMNCAHSFHQMNSAALSWEQPFGVKSGVYRRWTESQECCIQLPAGPPVNNNKGVTSFNQETNLLMFREDQEFPLNSPGGYFVPNPSAQPMPHSKLWLQ